MSNKTLREKWLNTVSEFCAGKKPTCPNCGGNNFKDGYLLSKVNSNYGWGAVWCENCRNAFIISRVGLSDGKIKNKVVNSLPDDLKYIG